MQLKKENAAACTVMNETERLLHSFLNTNI